MRVAKGRQLITEARRIMLPSSLPVTMAGIDRSAAADFRCGFADSGLCLLHSLRAKCSYVRTQNMTAHVHMYHLKSAWRQSDDTQQGLPRPDLGACSGVCAVQFCRPAQGICL